MIRYIARLARMGLPGVLILVLSGAAGLAQATLGVGPTGARPPSIIVSEGDDRALRLAITTINHQPEDAELAAKIEALITRDLTITDLISRLGPQEGLPPHGPIDQTPYYEDWRAVAADALLISELVHNGDQLELRFRLHDVILGRTMGDGLALEAPVEEWSRIAHRAADKVYQQLIGEAPLFDSLIVFIDVDGSAAAPRKRLGLMDFEGANVTWLSDGPALTPAFSPDGTQIAYTNLSEGWPQIHLLDLATGTDQPLLSDADVMTLGPNWSGDGSGLIYSRVARGISDLWWLDRESGETYALTNGPSLDTAPDMSPDGRRVVFESDRSGTPQLYIIDLNGGRARRISFGEGSFSNPSWSPFGDLIAYVERIGDRSHIGVMRPDGTYPRRLTESRSDDTPTWSPNGRMILHARQDWNEDHPHLQLVDITGRILRAITLRHNATDPDWGPLLP